VRAPAVPSLFGQCGRRLESLTHPSCTAGVYTVLRAQYRGCCSRSSPPSQADPKWFLRYTNIYVERPTAATGDMNEVPVTPHECRLRDLSYSANVFVDVRYWRGSEVNLVRRVPIGKIPIMLRSEHCYLRGMVSGRRRWREGV
jgi:DNA-directed RNA polymerase beta subunit